MQIETIQGSNNGVKYDIAPNTTFDAVLVSNNSNKTLTDVMTSLQAERQAIIVPMEWADGNPAGDDRVGKFVTLVAGERKIKIASPIDSVYGITVPDTTLENYSTGTSDSTKAFVCIFGIVSVICKDGYTDTDLNNGVRVTISESGNAVKINTTYGYPVIAITDTEHVVISMIPNLDSLNRLAVQMEDIISRFPNTISMSVENGDVIISHEVDESVVTE